MSKYKPASGPSFVDIKPWLERAWPTNVSVQLSLYPQKASNQWYPAVELFWTRPSGLRVLGVRFGQLPRSHRDEDIMAALFRAAVECAGWSDEQGDDLARRVEWEAGARGFKA